MVVVVFFVVGVVLRDHNATKTSRLLRLPFVVRFVFVLFKEEEEEEEEEAILVGVVDDVVANENMAMLMTLIRVMCVFMCVYLRVYRIQDIMEKSTHFSPQLVFKTARKVSPSERL